MDISTQVPESLLSLLWGISAGTFALFFLTGEEDPALSEAAGGVLQKRRERKGILLKLMMPLIVVLGQVMSALPLTKSREKYKVKLTQAGFPGGLSPDEFIATRIIAVVVGGLCGAFIDNEIAMSPMLLIVLSFVGFIYPDLWLSGVIQKRRRSIFRDLPDTLDILRLAVDAGLDLSSAMKVVVEKGRRGPLLDELEKVEREISLGRTRKEAFRNFADRIAMTEVNSFVLALLQADQLGASVGPILKVQGEMARTRRWQLAEVLVNKMPMKMLAPLVVFIFPASFIILFTPLLIQWMQAD